MGFPYTTKIRRRYLQATSTTSNTMLTVPVPTRSKYVTAFYATTPLQSHTATANTVETLQNNSVVVSSGAAATTSTGTVATEIPMTATSSIILSQGDVLVTVLSSCVGGMITHVVEEF